MKLMRFVRQFALVTLCGVAVSSMADAQPPRGEGGGGQPPQDGGRGDRGGRGRFGGGGGFGGGFGMGGFGGFRVDRAMLLGSDKVREELKIEEAQAATIDAALEAYREEQGSMPRPDRDALANMSEEEMTKYREERQKQRDELSRKTDEVLNALLEKPQSERLDQISLQLRMSSAALQTLLAEDVQKMLEVSEDQVAKLKEVEKVSQEEMQKMFDEMRANFQPGGNQGGGGGGDGMREKMEAARKKVIDDAMAVLSDSQKAKLEELKGAAFEVDMRSLFRFGGPGGPGGGGPGGGGPGGPGGGGPGGGRGGRGGRGNRPAE